MGDPLNHFIPTSTSYKGLFKYNESSPWSAIAKREIPQMMYATSNVYRMLVDDVYPDFEKPLEPVERNPYPEDDEENNLCEDMKLTPGDKYIIINEG